MAYMFVRKQFLFSVVAPIGAGMIAFLSPPELIPGMKTADNTHSLMAQVVLPPPELIPGMTETNASCSLASFGGSCVNVEHDGLRVTSVIARRWKGDPENICNYTATLSVTTPGVPYPITYKPKNPSPGECSAAVAFIGFPSYKTPKNVPSGTTYCTRWYENDTQQGKTTCLTLK